MIGRHRGGRSLRRRLVVAVLAAAIGRGYLGRHRLAEQTLGIEPGRRTSEVLTVPTPAAAPTAVPGTDRVATGRSSVAPWLRVVPAPAQPDQLADTVPHPVVALFPLSSGTAEAASNASGADSVDERVFAMVDAERESTAVARLAAGAVIRPYRPRHTA